MYNKRHILFIVENNPVPADIRVWREAMTVKHAGYDVTVISPMSKKFPKSHEMIDGIEIYRHPSFKGMVGKSNRIVEYVSAFFWEVILSLKIYVMHQFHVIHAANPPDHVFLLATAFKIFGVKFIFDHHDLTPELFLSKFDHKYNTIFCLLNLMENLSCHIADVVISTNESYKKHIIQKHGIMQAKIFIVRNDPELPKNPGRATLRQNTNKQIAELLYVGSINMQDGVDLLVRTIDILVNQLYFKQVRCIVVGDGADLPRVKKLCVELYLEQYLRFTGYIFDRQHIIDIIEETDICLEPAPKIAANSKSTFIKIMEYMAAGKPIVAFDMDETSYSTQGSALLIEPGKLLDFARAIMKLANEPDLRKQLGKYGSDRIATSLNWDNSAKELLRAYNYLKFRTKK